MIALKIVVRAKKMYWDRNISVIFSRKKNQEIWRNAFFFIPYTSNSMPDGYFIRVDPTTVRPQTFFSRISREKKKSS